jgi:hypothetical protein
VLINTPIANPPFYKKRFTFNHPDFKPPQCINVLLGFGGNIALKVIHIDRQALNREAEAKAFWENVLKPKLERRARERGEKLMMILKTKENALRQDFPSIQRHQNLVKYWR